MLPPERFFSGVSRLGVLTANSSTSFAACASMLRKLRKMPRENRGEDCVVQEEVLLHGKLADGAVAHPLFGDVGHARLPSAG